MNNIMLTDDMVLFLSRYYLGDRDRLSVAMSGASERFTFLYLYNRTKLVPSRCHFIIPSLWESFFQENISPLMITTFDASHCYWLPSEVLSSSITQMTNLEELNIQDTKMSLIHSVEPPPEKPKLYTSALIKLPKVFESCQKIVKFSFSLTEKNLDQFQEDVIGKKSLDWMKKGFRQLTHLKIFSFVALNDWFISYEPWFVTLGVMKWCRDCVDLLIEITDTEKSHPSSYLNDTDFNATLAELLLHLGWMKTLKSLTILRNDSSDIFHNHHYLFIRKLLFFRSQFQEASRFEANSLERLCITKFSTRVDHFGDFLESFMSGPSVKSFVWLTTNYWIINSPESLDHELFRLLEQLGHITFSRLAFLPELTYIHGKCERDIQGLNDFCQSHQKLKELHFLAPLGKYGEEANQSFGVGDWKLLSLQVLSYLCQRTSQRIMDHLIKACPNIDQLEIQLYPGNTIGKIESVLFFSSISFKHLTRLSFRQLKLFDGSYFLSIFQKCPKLERLHLEGDFESQKCLPNLARFLPTAANLRDLRLQWRFSQNRPSDLASFLNALKCCPQIERLVLYVENEGCLRLHSYAPLENCLVPFVKKMPRLVAFCLVGFRMDPSAVKQQLLVEVSPDRPAFWFYLGPNFPEHNDPSVPKIHYDEMVKPLSAYDSPPRSYN